MGLGMGTSKWDCKEARADTWFWTSVVAGSVSRDSGKCKNSGRTENGHKTTCNDAGFYEYRSRFP